MPTGGTALVPLPSTTSLPANVAMTTTLNGVFVPFVVRLETGTMGRGIYQNAVLFDPTTDAAPTPFTPPKGWNKRLLAQHGSGCPGGWYMQGPAQGVNILTGVDLQRLSEGWGIFINTLQHPPTAATARWPAEATMMGKEHFIETFGVPMYTLSNGSSGGAITSEGVGDVFPGMFDGIMLQAAFPDTLAIPQSGTDGHLLAHYFTVTNPSGLPSTSRLRCPATRASRRGTTPPTNRAAPTRFPGAWTSPATRRRHGTRSSRPRCVMTRSRTRPARGRRCSTGCATSTVVTRSPASASGLMTTWACSTAWRR